MAYTSDAVPRHLLHEVKLYKNSAEREMYDNLGNIFAIIQTIEHLERAYIKDSVTAREYEGACEKLIAQYKAAYNLVRGDISDDISGFMKKYRLLCPAAKRRIEIGVPATVEYGGDRSEEGGNNAKHVAATVSLFITVMDSLSMDMKAVDEIYPNMSDLMSNLNKLSKLPPDFEAKVKVREWLVTLNKMKASDEISEEQKRQLLFDLETAHTAFTRSLE